MRILLLSPAITHFDIEHEIKYSPSVPLGLSYLASYLRSKGLEDITIRDLMITAREPQKTGGGLRFGRTNAEILALLEEQKPDLVGITSMFTRLATDVYETARIVKAFSPGIPVVVGGSHVSEYPELSLKCPEIDVVCIGEGEETFFELVQALGNGKDYTSIAGTCVRHDGGFRRNAARPLIDLATVPPPARDLLEMDVYIRSMNSIYSLRQRQSSITSSRGCPCKCIYCTVRSVYGRTWRGWSPKRVVDEIESLVRDYNIGEIAWQDDSASVDKRRLHGICDEIIERGLDVKMITPNGIAYWTLDEELMDKMLKAGFYRLTFGIESGNLETRKFIRKEFSLEQATRLVRHANRIGMWITSTNIIGFPYETREQAEETISFQINSGFDLAVFYFLQPNPCSDVYQYFKKEGLLDLDDVLDFSDKPLEERLSALNKALNFEAGVDTLHMTRQEIQQIIADGYKRFIISRFKRYLLRPWLILRKVHNLEEAKFLGRLMLIAPRIYLRAMLRKVGLYSLFWS